MFAPLLLLLLQAPAGASPPPVLARAAQPAPKQIVAEMQRFYDRTKDFKAEFRQVLTSALYGRKQTFDGTVKFKKPGKMRWDYTIPDKKLFVSDGKVLWVYEPEDNQAFRQPLGESQLPSAITFLAGTGKLEREFDIMLPDPTSAKLGEPGDSVVRLVPKTPNARYREILLDIDARTFQVKQTLIVDTQGNTNQVSFAKIELNRKLPDSLFSWSPPAGTKIVRPGAN